MRILGGCRPGQCRYRKKSFKKDASSFLPVKLMVGGQKHEDVWRMLLANMFVRPTNERETLQAQLAANHDWG